MHNWCLVLGTQSACLWHGKKKKKTAADEGVCAEPEPQSSPFSRQLAGEPLRLRDRDSRIGDCDRLLPLPGPAEFDRDRSRDRLRDELFFPSVLAATFPFSSPLTGETERDFPRLPLRLRLDFDSSFDFLRLRERLSRSFAGDLERLREASLPSAGDLEREALRDFRPPALLAGDFDRLRLDFLSALPSDRLRLRLRDFGSLLADRDRLRLDGLLRFLTGERDRLRLAAFSPLSSLFLLATERLRLRLAGFRSLLTDRLRRLGDRERLRDLRRGAGDLERDSLERRRREPLLERRLTERERLRERDALRERRRFCGLRLLRRLEPERDRRLRRGERLLERLRLRLRLLEKLRSGFSSMILIRRPLISVLSSFSIARFMSE